MAPRWIRPIAGGLVIVGMVAIAQVGRATWQEQEIRASVSTVNATYPWLAAYVYQLEADPESRVESLIGATPDSLAGSYVDFLWRQVFAPAYPDGEMEQLAAHVRWRNRLASVCRAWPHRGLSPRCFAASRMLVSVGWATYFDDSGAAEDYYLYGKGEMTRFGAKVPGELQLCGLASYRVRAAVTYEPTEFDTVTESWVSLAPGQCQTIVRKFSAVRPAFAVAAFAADSDTRAWVAARVAEVARIERPFEPPVAVQAAALRGLDIDTAQCVATGEAAAALRSDRGIKQACPEKATTLVGFALAGARPAEANSFFFGIEDPNWPLLGHHSSVDQDQLTLATSRAEQLGESVARQIRFDRDWGGPGYEQPFSLDGELIDWNGPLNPGVALASVLPVTIFGSATPLRSDDVILSVNGVIVFGERDLLLELMDHGLTAGIAKPLHLEVLRAEGVVPIATSFRFNTNYPAFAETTTWRRFSSASPTSSRWGTRSWLPA